VTRVERFSTREFPQDAKVDRWNRLASETFGDLTVSPANARNFRGDLARVKLDETGGMGLAVARSAPAVVDRAPGRLGWATLEPVFFLHLVSEGTTVCEQDGRQAVLRPGDLCLCTTERPYSLALSARNEMIVVKLPSAVVRQRIARPETKVGLRMGAEGVRAGLLSSLMRGAGARLDGASEADWRHAFAQSLLDLTELTYADPEGEADAHARLRRRAEAMIGANLSDPHLTPAAVAQGVGVGLRHLQMAFAQVRTTPSDVIREARLELARRMLASGREPRSITQLALEAGFGDLTYFSRAFRARFGATPRAYRDRRG
jgi:AraC-like DNA-binding protein